MTKKLRKLVYEQDENINKEIEFIKGDQTEILEMRITVSYINSITGIQQHI